jgi:hypothetical protein
MAKKLAPAFTDEDEDVAARPAVALSAAGHRDMRGLLISDAPDECETADEFTEAIGVLWGKAEGYFLEIGRHLIKAKDMLPHGEFQVMIDKRLPFQPAMANKLMAVARAIDAGLVPVRLMPQAYTLAYEIVTMPEEVRRAAIEEGVVRQNVTRREIVDFKKRMRGKATAPPEDAVTLRRRLEKLQELEQKIKAEIAQVQEKLAGY